MTALQTLKKPEFHLDLLRDDCKVIERRGGSAADVKKAFAKLHKILDSMPRSSRTAADVRKTRNNRGKV